MVTEQQAQEWRRLEERLEQDAQDGQWAADGKTVVIWQDDEKYYEIIADTFNERNAAFIAASRTAVPALLAERDALAAERDAWQKRSESADVAWQNEHTAWVRTDEQLRMMTRERDALAVEVRELRAQLAGARSSAAIANLRD